MKLLAVIFSVFGLVALVVTASCRWGFIDLHLQGPEEGLIVGSLAFSAGAIVSVLATVFAFIASRRPETGKASRFLLGFCCLLLLSFAIVLIA